MIEPEQSNDSVDVSFIIPLTISANICVTNGIQIVKLNQPL